MNSLRPTNKNLDGIVPYDPKYLPARAMLSANENPANVPSAIIGDILVALAKTPLNRYPDPLANDLRDVLADAYGLSRENVLVGNGGDELLFNIAFAWGGPGRTMLDLPPTFSVYAANAQLCGTNIVNIERSASDFAIDEEAVLARLAEGDVDYLTICTPNNPTGTTASLDFIERVLNATDALVLVDEAYGEFGGESALPLLAEHKNLAILHTFSKAYSMAAVRLGFLLASPEIIAELCKVRQPYSVDAISQLIGRRVMKFRDLFDVNRALIVAERDRVFTAMKAMEGVDVWPSASNFLLFCVDEAVAPGTWQAFYDAGVLVRDFSANPLTHNCFRVSMGSPEQNDSFLAVLQKIVEG